MVLLVYGINHKTAAVALRERVAFPPERVLATVTAARQATALAELALLSTCNRTEFYAVGTPEQLPALRAWLATTCGLSPEALAAVDYSHEAEGALAHAMRVAAGLDSMILGEPQILGQLKAALADADASGQLGPLWRRAAQAVFAAAKQIRTETAIGQSPVSVGYAAVTLARQVFERLADAHVLLVGAGEMNALVGRHLKEQGVQRLTVINRTADRAAALAAELSAEIRPWSELAGAIQQADVVISCTGALMPFITPDLLAAPLRQRRHRPLLLIDIAVPRDIDPAVARFEDVFLYSIDDLQSVIDAGWRQRAEAARAAQGLIDQHCARYEQTRRIQQDAAGVIARLRQQAAELLDEERQRAVQQLQAGESPEQVIARLQHSMMNRWLHAPTVALRALAAEGSVTQLQQLARGLGLVDEDSGS